MDNDEIVKKKNRKGLEMVSYLFSKGLTIQANERLQKLVPDRELRAIIACKIKKGYE